VSKLVFIVTGRDGMKPADFTTLAVHALAPSLLAQDPAGLKLSITSPDLPRPRHLPTSKQLLALVSVWSDGAPSTWSERVAAWALPFAGYRVSESAPRVYARDWPDGEPTPGLCMLTLFRRRQRLTQAEFLHRWHDLHSPIALRTHPLWSYVRNVVEESLTTDAPPWAGIVEEHFRRPEELTSVRRFFGGTLNIVPALVHVVWQTSTFLDLLTLRNYVLREHWLRTPPMLRTKGCS
jgi:hypothetical protein